MNDENTPMKKTIILPILIFLISSASFSRQYGWTDISDNIPQNTDLADVFFISDNEGCNHVSSGTITVQTANGGATFLIQTNQFSTFLAAIYLIVENEGVTGNESRFVYCTVDGGINRNLHGSLPFSLRSIDFTPAIRVYAYGKNGAVCSSSESITNFNRGQPTNSGKINFWRLTSGNNSLKQKFII